MPIELTFPSGGALVAGGTGRFGEGIVRQFAKAGIPLVFTYLNSDEKARALEAEVLGQGCRVISQRMDVEDEHSIESAMQRVIREYGRLHTRLDEGGNLTAFLASDQASFLTGQIINLDGGATL